MTKLKQKLHYVPQFWLRGFADHNNQLHAKCEGRVGVVSPGDMMQENWLYTLFNSRWEASDTLEDALAEIEGVVAPLFEAVTPPPSPARRSGCYQSGPKRQCA